MGDAFDDIRATLENLRRSSEQARKRAELLEELLARQEAEAGASETIAKILTLYRQEAVVVRITGATFRATAMPCGFCGESVPSVPEALLSLAAALSLTREGEEERRENKPESNRVAESEGVLSVSPEKGVGWDDSEAEESRARILAVLEPPKEARDHEPLKGKGLLDVTRWAAWAWSRRGVTLRCDAPGCVAKIMSPIDETWSQFLERTGQDGWSSGETADYCPEHADADGTP